MKNVKVTAKCRIQSRMTLKFVFTNDKRQPVGVAYIRSDGTTTYEPIKPHGTGQSDDTDEKSTPKNNQQMPIISKCRPPAAASVSSFLISSSSALRSRFST